MNNVVPLDGVHPRVCGEAADRLGDGRGIGGPSPRVRGSHTRTSSSSPPSGSIPACAGKPSRSSCARSPAGVHPRVCGKAARKRCRQRPARGPSPRVRGSRECAYRRGLDVGSIPACAGKPLLRPTAWRWRRVHPRVCGEASSVRATVSCSRGPSPRVRGSPSRVLEIGRPPGSIPACAGKPETGRGEPDMSEVHPRVCGEAMWKVRFAQPIEGPSPRVRGSPTRQLIVHQR